jgi:serine O-acetyltransferase
MNLIYLHKITNFLYKAHIPLFPKLLYCLQFILFNSSVPPSCNIGKGTKFAYGGIGAVIHGRSKIGCNCTIGQGITIGGRSKHYNVPTIGNNVYLGAGCRILGPISIGDNVIIGPNSVVIDNIPSNSIAVGIPAKVIKENIEPDEFV